MVLTRKIKNIVEPFYKRLFSCCVGWFRYLPITQNKIVFVQGCGRGYRCNLKYVAEEIKRRNLPYKLVWLVEQMDMEIPQPIRKVKYNRIRAVYELATARVFLNNTKSFYPVRKKQGQIFIYIPHGQPGCKCAEGDGNLPKQYVCMSKQHSALTDVFVSMGKYHTQVLKDTFWVPDTARIWECGFPRNDQYYKDNARRVSAIREELGIPKDVRIAFYAPTFRDNGKTDAYNLDLHRVLHALEAKTGEQWMLFITLHNNFIWFDKPVYDFDDRIWNMTFYTDIHELLLLADIAISDYSSVALDFANTRRPVFLYASDIDAYTRIRGLKSMYYQLPFPLCKTNDEMEQAIMTFDKEEYAHRLEEFAKIYGSVDDGHAAERFVDHLEQIMNNKQR